MLQEPWMLGKIIILAMFENEDSIFVQQVAIQYEVWNLRKFLQRVWRIGKDEIKLLLAGLQEAEHIATNQKILVFAQLLKTLADEVGVVAVCLYADDALATSGNEFQRDAARSGKEVEGGCILKIDVTLQNIKDILLCKICCRARLERTWNVEMATLILSCYDSHFIYFELITLNFMISYAVELTFSSAAERCFFTLHSSLTQVQCQQVERHSFDFRDRSTVEFCGGIQEESLPDVKLTVIKEPVLVRNFARNV